MSRKPLEDSNQSLGRTFFEVLGLFVITGWYKGDCCRCEVSAMMVSEWVGVLEVGLVGCHHLIIIDLIHPQHCHPENNTSLHCPFNFTKLSGTIRDKLQRHGVTDWWNDNGGQGKRVLWRFCSSLWNAHLTLHWLVRCRTVVSRKHFLQIHHHHCMVLQQVIQLVPMNFWYPGIELFSGLYLALQGYLCSHYTLTIFTKSSNS